MSLVWTKSWDESISNETWTLIKRTFTWSNRFLHSLIDLFWICTIQSGNPERSSFFENDHLRCNYSLSFLTVRICALLVQTFVCISTIIDYWALKFIFLFHLISSLLRYLLLSAIMLILICLFRFLTCDLNRCTPVPSWWTPLNVTESA